MKHDVSIFAIVRVKCRGIEARDRTQAADRALGFLPDLYALFDSKNIRHLPEGVAEVEFAEEISHYRVDGPNNPGCERSTWLNRNGRRMAIVRAA